MKIRAIRLREVGCFSKPVALEGLSGGLDVLAGPNEAGKSTILRALRALFLERHHLKNKTITNLQPSQGGAPMIEVDFDVEGERWRLRKQFLQSKSAVLTDLSTSNVVARGEDADARSVELISTASNSTGAGIGLLWMAQKQTLEPIKIEDDEDAFLRTAIQAQISDIVGDGDTRRVLALAEKAIKPLIGGGGKGANNKPSKGSDFDKCLVERAELEEKLAAAESEQAAATGRVEELAVLHKRESELVQAGKQTGSDKTLRDAASDLKKKREAAQKKSKAQEVLKRTDAERNQAAQELESFRKQLTVAREAEAALNEATEKFENLRPEIDAAKVAFDKAAKAREAGQKKVAALNTELKSVAAAEKRSSGQAQLAELQRRAHDAKSADKDVKDLERSLAKMLVSKDQIVEAQADTDAITRLDAQLSAAMPTVSIAYEPGSKRRIRLDGDVVPDGKSIEADGPIVLRIDGVGEVTIAPGASSETEQMRTQLASHRKNLSKVVKKIGVVDLGAAKAALSDKENSQSLLRESRSKLASSAPDGLSVLAAAIAELQGVTDDPSLDDVRLRADVERDILRADQDLAEVRSRRETLQIELTEKTSQHTNLSQAIVDRRTQLATLLKDLPSLEARPARELQLDDRLKQVQRQRGAAEQDLADWSAKAGDDAERENLASVVEEQERTKAEQANTLNKVRHEIERVRGALERDEHTDTAAAVSSLRADLVRVEERISRFERDRDALQLLVQTLKAVEDETHNRYFAPVVERLQPLLGQVFPNAALAFADGFTPRVLEREGLREDLAALSDGTQEQLAILVRLAFARLLADSGQTTPVVLDDPLAYADDERLKAMFETLRQAAEQHQVFVLTCREESFASLGGTRLKLESWQPS